MDPSVLSHRDRAILRAVAAGRAEILVGCCPDITVDGLWCDHVAAAQLVARGWIRPLWPAKVGERVAAGLTDAACAVAGDWQRRSA